MNEIWKDIKEYEGKYQVSNLGHVKSLDMMVWNGQVYYFRQGRILNPIKKENGYLQIRLFNKNTKGIFYVHRLVAQAFIPNPNNYPVVNHKDETRDNNNVDNLEWCTAKYNLNYGNHNEKISKTVYQYTLEGQYIKKWKTTKELKESGFKRCKIGMCCRGEKKTYKGYVWSYKLN